MPRSNRWVAEQNIARYRQMLLAEQDEAARQVLQRLLDEEEAKLAELTKNARHE